MLEQSYIRLEHSNPEHAHVVVINWCAGNLCNFACSYCPSGLHDGSQPWIDLHHAQRFVDQVFDHYGPHRQYFFEFTGGEITLYRDFIPLVEHITARGGRIGIISNGSRSMDFWGRLKPHLSQVCLSFHAEQAKPDHFLEVVRFLSDEVRTHVNLMMSPTLFDTCLAVAERVVEIPNLSLALQPLIVDLKKDLYTYREDQLQVIREQSQRYVRRIRHTKTLPTFRGAMEKVYADGRREASSPHAFITRGTNNWRGWNCYVGVEQFVVDMDGKVMRGWCREGGAFGHINDSQVAFPAAPILCRKSVCHCNQDIMCTKVKT